MGLFLISLAVVLTSAVAALVVASSVLLVVGVVCFMLGWQLGRLHCRAKHKRA